MFYLPFSCIFLRRYPARILLFESERATRGQVNCGFLHGTSLASLVQRYVNFNISSRSDLELLDPSSCCSELVNLVVMLLSAAIAELVFCYSSSHRIFDIE